MKRLYPLLIMIPLVMMLGACAGTANQQAELEVEEAANFRFDAEYMQRVNEAASRHNTRVYWVNPPRKRDSSDR